MTKLLKAALLGSLLAVTPFAKAGAQTSRTNVLLNLTFNLTSYEQVLTDGSIPSARIAKVATSGVISAIARYAHIPGDLSNAKLYYRLSWTDPTNITQDIILRIGHTDTNVNANIFVSFPDKVSQQRATLSGTINATEYANCNMGLGVGALGSFQVSGIATRKSASLTMNGRVIDHGLFPTSFSASVAGTGLINFHQAEWKGTVMAAGQKVEIVPVSP